MAQRNGEDDSTTSFPTPAFLGPSHRSKAPPPAPQAQGPLGGTLALPLPLAAGERKWGMQGGERGYGWTPNLKTSSRKTGLLQPPLPPDAGNAKRVPPWQGQPSSYTRLLWGTHSGTEGAETKGRIRGQIRQRLGGEVPWESPEPQRQRIGHSQPLRMAVPRLLPGGPAPPSPVGREPPGGSHVEDSSCRCSLESSQILGRSERKRHRGLFLLPLPPRTSAPRGRGANAAVTASH